MNKLTDWTDMGVIPLQDWRDGIELGRKMTMAGARVVRMSEEGASETLPIEIARERDKGTIGDIHPWLLIQTAARSKRPMGSWVMGHAAIASDAQTGANTGASPMRGWRYQADLRYEASGPADVPGLPRRVKGQLGAVWPSMRDDGPSALWIHGDPRLVCPSISGPYDAATLVCDLQPSMELCMDGSQVPGVGGRHARLQSALRVVAIDPAGTGGILSSSGNGLALNLNRSADGLLGMGMCWIPLAAGQAPVYGPTTGPRTQQSVEMVPDQVGPDVLTGDTGSGFGAGQESGGTEDLGPEPREHGTFTASPASASGIAFLANSQAGGPIHGGCMGDKHRLGTDRDGNAMNAGHLATTALWYENPDKDGPMLFEGFYPNPAPLSMLSPVHLTWDRDLVHQFPGGAQRGMWRWHAEVPYITPGGGNDPPGIPPTGGGGRGPITPGGGRGPGGPTPGAPGGPTTPPRREWRWRFEPLPPGHPGAGGGGRTGGPGPGGRGGGPGGTGGPRPGYPTTPGGGGEYNPFAGLRNGPIEPKPGPPLSEPPVRWDDEHGRWDWRGTGPDGKPVWYDSDGNVLHEEPARVPKIGGLTRETRNQFSIHHPYAESFSGVWFRPQLIGRDYPNFERGQHASRALMEWDEYYRPHVIGLRSWGAQAQGDWAYTTLPDDSRVRGGVASGGILVTPPSVELEDYLHPSDGSRTANEIENPPESSSLTIAPGVRLALGTPHMDGGHTAGVVTLRQDQASSGELDAGAEPGQGALLIEQADSTRTAQVLLRSGIDQTSGEIHTVIGGTASVRVPSGNDAARPASPSDGDLRANTEGTVAELEHFDDAGGTGWRKVVSAVGAGAGDILYHDGTEWKLLAAGSAGQVLTMGGSGLPEWSSP